jgi:hypothetical protein
MTERTRKNHNPIMAIGANGDGRLEDIDSNIGYDKADCRKWMKKEKRVGRVLFVREVDHLEGAMSTDLRISNVNGTEGTD